MEIGVLRGEWISSHNIKLTDSMIKIAKKKPSQTL
jgi:hypothetical protein